MSTQAITGDLMPPSPLIESDLGEIIVDKRGCKRYKATGQLLPGQRLNPSGRPQSRHITEALREKLANGDASKLAERALKIAKTAKSPAVQLAAVQFIKEAVEGKAVQAVAVQHSVDESTMKRIAELSERLLSCT